MASVAFLYNKTANISFAIDGASGSSDSLSTDLFQIDYIFWINITNVVGASFSMTATAYHSVDNVNWFSLGSLAKPATGTTFTAATPAIFTRSSTSPVGPYVKIGWTLSGADSACTVQYLIAYDKRR